MKKKYFIILVDIMTIILTILHSQAMLLMIIESFQVYNIYTFSSYILLNINIIYNKYRDIRKKNNIFNGRYKYTIIINILFVLFKTIEYYFRIITIMGR